jgi:hypothetical protein
VTYTCPEGYTRNGTTCTNDCTEAVKEGYQTRIENDLKNPNITALLTVNESTRQIKDRLEIFNNQVTLTNKEEKDGQLYKFTYETKLNLKINDNVNRYYNKITSEVNDSKLNSNYIDRGQGVISISRNQKTFGLNNIVNNYNLMINDIQNVGINNSFNEEIKNINYVCQYRVTDKNACKCPNGTKNEGDSVYELLANIKSNKNTYQVSSNTDVENSCLELQETYCNYTGESYCIDCNNQKQNITACVQEKMQTMTYEKAYNICGENTCHISKCNNYCTKNCNYIDNVIGNTVYTIQKCNNNTEICGFYLHCINDKETSQSYLDLLSKKLNTTNIVTSIKNNTINTSNIEGAIRTLDTNICGIKTNAKVVYRVIDLNRPFLTKDGNIRTSGYNWNSEKIIKEKITNNRGVEGNKVYTKDPIITITLTPQNIKKIREYNKNKNYNDNDLTCNNNVSCISNFIHGDTNSLTSMGVKISGISECTNLKTNSNTTSFNECYNSNN